MSFSIPLTARILPVLFCCVAALRVGEVKGESANVTQEDQSLLLSPVVHNESVATIQDSDPQVIAPALLTKMRATLLKKQSKKSRKYHLIDDPVMVHSGHTNASHDAHSIVQNISAVPTGAAPLQFQRATESEFQSAAHQAVLPQMPQPHMIKSALQSPEIFEEEDHIPQSLLQIKAVSSTTSANNSKESEGQVLMQGVEAKPRNEAAFDRTTSANNSKESEGQVLMQGVEAKPRNDITIRVNVDVNVKLQNSTVHTEIDSAVNDSVDLNIRLQNRTDESLHTEIDSAMNGSVIQPETWLPEPNKKPTMGPLYGKPFVSNNFPQGNVSSSAAKEAVKVQVEEPKVNDTEKAPLPLPPRTLYGKPYSRPFGNDSVAFVDSPVAMAKISSFAEPHQVLWGGSFTSTIQAQQTPLNVHVASHSPSAKRASIVRSRSPDTPTTGAVTESPWGVTAMYYPGHWGSESPAVIREPKDSIVRREGRQEPVAIWLVLMIVTILFMLIMVLFCVMPLKNSCPWPEGNEQTHKGEVRCMVESLRISSVEDIESTFKPRGGYDCLLLQPQNPGMTVRIQGIVVASQNATLRSPITRRKCVLFSTSALERRLDGVVAPPQAFHSMAVNFALELSPLVTLKIRGQDVALFDMVAGRHEENVVLRDASELVQDFVRSHRTPFFGARDIDALDFQECILEVGAKVTCVGEVRRSENGELGLWPLHHDVPSDALYAAASGPSGLTSWERLGSSGTGESQVEKVMISDDPHLLR